MLEAAYRTAGLDTNLGVGLKGAFGPLVAIVSSRSITSTGNGDATTIQPATGAVDRGSENINSFSTPLATVTDRWAEPVSDATLTT